jgi:hypothetical protein
MWLFWVNHHREAKPETGFCGRHPGVSHPWSKCGFVIFVALLPFIGNTGE